ncbi:MAG: GTPase HflX [Halanaerobiales bacterium]
MRKQEVIIILLQNTQIDSTAKKRNGSTLLLGGDRVSLQELQGLARTAGISVDSILINNSDNIDPAYYIGSGSLKSVRKKINLREIDLVIFDNELTPAQFRNLEEKLGIRVIDRTQLILDIFSGHAHTRESKLQVELARLEYLLPRLKGKGEKLSRLGGGIGTRGPGETKMEIDRRRIEKRIYRLREKLKEIDSTREVQRSSRTDPVVALVGYTNAGKSTLLNLLTESESKVADKLFATLDSRLRSMELPVGRRIILCDTVGFISRLPHQLVASFRATLEEIKEADFLLHVIDAAHPCYRKHIKVVDQVLKDMGADSKTKIMLFNKIDKVEQDRINDIRVYNPDGIFISACTSKGIEKLTDKLSKIVKKDMETIKIDIPYEKAHLVEQIHDLGKVKKEKYNNNTIEIEAMIPDKMARKLRPYT